MLADVLERAGVHERVLTELHLDQVEPKGLRLPDELLQRAVRGAHGAGRGQRALNNAQVGNVVVGRGVHDVCRALDGGAQAVRDHDHDGAVQLGGGDLEGALREDLAQLDLVVPQVHKRVGGLGEARVQREVAAHVVGPVGQGLKHVHAELLGHLAAHLSCDVGVAVAVGANPAAGVEERRAHGRHGAGALAQLPVVEAAIDLGHHVEERGVEDVDDGVGLLDGRGLLVRDGRGAHQRVNLLQHEALVLHQLNAGERRALGEKLGDAADLALDRLAPRLGGVRGKDGVELQAVEKRRCLGATALVYQLAIGHREVVDGIGRLGGGNLALAAAQRGHAVVLLADVRQVEVGDEGTHEQRRPVHGKPVDGGDKLLERLLGQGGLVVSARHAVGVRHADGVTQQQVEGGEKVRVVLLEHLANKAQEERQVVTELLGHVDQRKGRLCLLRLACPDERASLPLARSLGCCHVSSLKLPPVPPTDLHVCRMSLHAGQP